MKKAHLKLLSAGLSLTFILSQSSAYASHGSGHVVAESDFFQFFYFNILR